MQTPCPSVDETLHIAIDDTKERQGYPSFAAAIEVVRALLEIAETYWAQQAALCEQDAQKEAAA